MLTGWTPGVGLDERGREQAKALADRLAPVPLAAIVTSPLDRCQQTAEAIADASDGGPAPVTDECVGECRYGDWTGKPLKERHREEFLGRILRELERYDVDAEAVARAVFLVMANHISEGEVADVEHVLPREVRDLWPSPARARSQ